AQARTADAYIPPTLQTAPPPAAPQGAPPATYVGAQHLRPNFFDDEAAPVVSVKHWLGSFALLMLLPLAVAIVGGLLNSFLGIELISIITAVLASLAPLILMLIWAFSKKTNPSKRNMFRATLILTLIVVVLVAALAAIVSSFFAPLLSEMALKYAGLL
ncbi:MAG: hypothetical protein Q4B96_06615, partial [Bacillota bacterium]|nr:hypothetical protein [Bacillota bacterium]